MKPSMSVAYAMKKKKCHGGKMSEGGVPYSKMEESKRSNMASGGTVQSGDPTMNYNYGGKVPRNTPSEHEKGINKATSQMDPGTSKAHVHLMDEDAESAKWVHKKSMQDLKKSPGPMTGKSGFAEGGMTMDNDGPVSPEEAKKFKAGSGFAEGGFIGSHQSACTNCGHPVESIHEEASGYAKETHPMEHPTEQGLTEDGYQSESHDEDMIHRVMAKRMSKGGKVANEDMPEADFMPNEFDDLHLRDSLEFSDTGSNSGDEDGEPEGVTNEDPVKKVMKSRRKK